MKRPIIEEALKNLLNRYGVESVKEPGFIQKEDELRPDYLAVGHQFVGKTLVPGSIPLLTWRLKRSITELRKIIQEEIVEGVCLLRFSYLGTAADGSITDLIYQKLDLCEFITGSEVISVFATISDSDTANIIAKLKTGVICSIEISMLLPDGSELQERHEIIGRRGTASDRVVDTQVQQHSVYCFVKDGSWAFSDTDMELYGFDVKEIEYIRAAFEIYKDSQLRDQWIKQHHHLESLVKAVGKSQETQERVLILEKSNA